MWTQDTWSFVGRLILSIAVGGAGIAMMGIGSGVLSKAVASAQEKLAQVGELCQQQVTLVRQAAETTPSAATTQQLEAQAASKATAITSLLAGIAKLPTGDRLIVWGFIAVIVAAMIGGWLKVDLGGM
ncbi:hypothetical protein [Saccharothrix stipae]